MNIRQATRQDIAAMHVIRLAVRENRLTSCAIGEADYVPEIEQTGRGWVAEQEGRILGFAVANLNEASVWALFVAPEAEGRGCGSMLLQAMMECFRDEGISTVQLTTEPGTRAEAFYLKAGWQPGALQSNGDRLLVWHFD
ncbi:GNAT family N-acetyltransferase [Shewanella sp. JM162201]|uniref:GNAT family N-acetyltransferase n=1 Tax=Shewanella jiangmenensis TaxID=2837387 RepID=A0ABS5V2E8_9GAMM|nr:GNAT family N-acetyltransferase [Shewanella jiangmenensis]MBT1443806.1 GNAT family N-acetyltransferase [Shewanella jiangmenensis]